MHKFDIITVLGIANPVILRSSASALLSHVGYLIALHCILFLEFL